jgi:PadR family transcriptional regulator, regulatory protein PadR
MYDMDMQEVRLTLAVLRVLRHFVDDPGRPRYGYDLMQATGYASGRVYPILARLETAGWLVRERESVYPAEAGRPVRATYVLTEEGAEQARQVLSEQSTLLAPPPRPEPQPGQRTRLRPQGGLS